MTDRKWTPININAKIRVKLTPEGIYHYAKKMEEMRRKHPNLTIYKYPREDAEGRYTTQFWSLMQDFGDACILGFPAPFTDIEIEND